MEIPKAWALGKQKELKGYLKKQIENRQERLKATGVDKMYDNDWADVRAYKVEEEESEQAETEEEGEEEKKEKEEEEEQEKEPTIVTYIVQT